MYPRRNRSQDGHAAVTSGLGSKPPAISRQVDEEGQPAGMSLRDDSTITAEAWGRIQL
jgi:hypothetical protein